MKDEDSSVVVRDFLWREDGVRLGYFESIEMKMAYRKAARDQGLFQIADELRREVEQQGVEMQDQRDGTTEFTMPAGATLRRRRI